MSECKSTRNRRSTFRGSWRLVLGAACLLASPMFLAEPALAADVGANGSIGGFEAKFVDVNGIRTRYYEVGQGERFHVFAPDKLASGMTDNPKSDDDFTIRAEVEHMYQFIQTMGIAPVHLVGQSRGGGLAFLLAVNHPDVVKTLVIVDSATAAPPAGDDRPNRRRRLFRDCPKEETPQGDQFRCHQAALAYRPVAVTDEYVAAAAYMWRQPKAQETRRRVTAAVREHNNIVTSEMDHEAYHKILTEGALKMPVLLYWGKNDPSVLPAQAYSFYNIIAETNPRAWLLFTNHGGHFHYQEHPEEFDHNVISFITAWE
jgi:2-hydroxy-6-oxonona-2,4-dienedioate hydrolase